LSKASFEDKEDQNMMLSLMLGFLASILVYGKSMSELRYKRLFQGVYYLAMFFDDLGQILMSFLERNLTRISKSYICGVS